MARAALWAAAYQRDDRPDRACRFATYGLLEDPTALFIGGLLLCSLFLAPFGQGTWGAVQELFPTEVRTTGFAAANFIGGTIASF